MDKLLTPEGVETADPERMYVQLNNFVDDCKNAWQESQAILIDESYKDVDNVVLLGMGGSGIASEMVKEIMAGNVLPIEVIHDYDLPGYVNNKSLVIANSYSGNTEETVKTFSEARKRGAKLFAITTGGEIKKMVEENSIPYFSFNYPSQPRMAFPYLFCSLLTIFTKLGFYELPLEFEEIWVKLKDITKNYLIDVPLSENPVKQLAMRIHGKLPIIYTSPLLKAPGIRLKTIFNENSNSFAFAEFFPELNHNAIEGYVFPKINAYFIMFLSQFDNDRIKLREKITSDIIKKSGYECEKVEVASSDNSLIEHLAFVSFSDNLSYYLALLNRTNPTAIPNILYLKDRL